MEKLVLADLNLIITDKDTPRGFAAHTKALLMRAFLFNRVNVYLCNMKSPGLINEIKADLSTAYPFKFLEKSREGGLFFSQQNEIDRYTFTTDSGTEYLVKFFIPYPSSHYMEGTKEREYGVVGDRNINANSLTGENKAISVNATVMAITLDWIKRNPDFTLLIIRPVDIRRFRLVQMFIDNNLPKEFNVEYDSQNKILIKNLDAIRKIKDLGEATAVEKSELGAGVDHTVYPSINNPKIVYKMGSDYAVQGWYDLFKENPDLFPNVYKMGKTKMRLKRDKFMYNGEFFANVKAGTIVPVTYVEVEKLNTKRAEDEWVIMDEIMSELTKDDFGWDFQDFVMSYNRLETPKYIDRLKDLDNEIKLEFPEFYKIFARFVLLLDRIYEVKPAADLHKYNFGYDSKGNLKCIDI